MDRRAFVKSLGIGTALVPGSKGEPERVEVPDPDQLPSDRLIYGGYSHPNVASTWLYSGATIDPYEMKGHYNLFSMEYEPYDITNMQLPFVMPAPTYMAIESVGVLFAPNSLAQVRQRFIEKYWLELWVCQRNYFRAPLSGLFKDGTPEDLKVSESIKAFEKLEIPVVVLPQMNFYITISGHEFRSSQKLKFWAALRVREARGVQ